MFEKSKQGSVCVYGPGDKIPSRIHFVAWVPASILLRPAFSPRASDDFCASPTVSCAPGALKL